MAPHGAGKETEMHFRKQLQLKLGETFGTRTWTVERHSGRSADHYRPLFSGDEATARAKFDAVSKELRQGGVRLIRPDGHTEFIVNGPRLRSRW